MGRSFLFSKLLMGKFRKIFFMALPENQEDMRKSRLYFVVGDTAAQTMVQLAGGTFIVTLMSFVGISDANIGILTSLASLAAIFQLITMQFVRRLQKRKLFICITVLQKILFSGIFFVPLLSAGMEVKALLVVLGYFFAQVWAQIGAPSIQDWIASLVPSRLRGHYFTMKDSIAVFVVVTATLIAGIILDSFKTDNIEAGFIIIGIVIAVLVLINLVALCFMKEPRVSYTNSFGKEMHGHLAKRAKPLKDEGQQKSSIFSELRTAFGQSKFRRVFILNCLWMTCFYIAAPFNSSYQIKELQLPYTFIMIVSFVVNMLRIYVAPKFGRSADRFGMAKVYRYSLLGIMLNYLFTVFSVPSNAFIMMPISAVFSSCGWAFVGIGLFGIQLDFLDKERRMVQLALLSSLSGVYGFLVSLVGGTILDYLQTAHLSLFGHEIYAQQVLNLLGVILIALTMLYVKKVIEPVQVQLDETDGEIT